MPSAGRWKMDGLWMTERWCSKVWGQWPAQGWGQSGPYSQAVLLLLQTGRKHTLLTLCTSLMEISSKMKLVSQSLPGMAVRRSRPYCWDTGPQLHRLCKARSHPGCQKLCRLPQLSCGPPCGQGAQERPIPPFWICCVKPQQHAEALHNCFSSWQAAQSFTWWWPQGWEKAPSKWWGFLLVVVAYFNFGSRRLMCPTAKAAHRRARQLGEWLAMNKKRGSAKCMR